MKQGMSLTVILAVAFAATRFLTAPSAPVAGYADKIESTIHTEIRKPRSSELGYLGGCSAYLPTSVGGMIADENRGAAKIVVDKFFKLDPSKSSLLPSSVRYAIALVPDPLHTHLGLMFDREIQLIQQAAQDELYTYDSSWLPWQKESQPYQLLADQQVDDTLTNQREACPGILLFRESSSDNGTRTSHEVFENALIVLVVGEQPTGGINDSQWSNAVNWLQRVASEPKDKVPSDSERELNVLGPSFSGSLASLDRQLGVVYRGKPPGYRALFREKFPKVFVFSGGVSSCTSVEWFNNRWPVPEADANHKTHESQSKHHYRASSEALVTFRNFQENDELQIYRFISYLKRQGTHPSDIAILSEDETAYGGSSQTGSESTTGGQSPPCKFPYIANDRPVHLFYPRDISALRVAYQKQAVFASGSETQNERTVHTVLREDQVVEGEGADTSDTIQSFGGNMVSFAEEGILYGIVSNLRTHHSRYLILRCSNPLDFLFLTRFFHRSYPEARIVTIGSDLLFRREVDTTEFRGVMALSNYPLLPTSTGLHLWKQMTPKLGTPIESSKLVRSKAYILQRVIFSIFPVDLSIRKLKASRGRNIYRITPTRSGFIVLRNSSIKLKHRHGFPC